MTQDTKFNDINLYKKTAKNVNQNPMYLYPPTVKEMENITAKYIEFSSAK